MTEMTLTDWKQNFRSLLHDTWQPLIDRPFTQHMMIHLSRCEDAMPPETCLLLEMPEGATYAAGAKRIEAHMLAHGSRPA